MTFAQLKRFIRMRGTFLNHSRSEFLLDLCKAGISAKEINPYKAEEPDGSRVWQTTHGRLVERDGKLSLEPIE